ncbi:MAG TPA: coenzyme F420-0:L-glutamate ligase, partial [Candidatus Acidoferrum sp.]|nr:coenzyme F420-0:L-glutamate ligase [Candidatus Acidoferrum sp.]
MPAELRVIGLEGVPEVRVGDNLGALLADALDRTPGALPLQTDDVLVVTQKVVSKAEGAAVDLSTIEPRPDAVEFARQFDRDAR